MIKKRIYNRYLIIFNFKALHDFSHDISHSYIYIMFKVMIEKEIILNDKKPEYQVDEFGGYLYYKANDRTIHIYIFNN